MCFYVNTANGKQPMLPIAAQGMLKQAGMMGGQSGGNTPWSNMTKIQPGAQNVSAPTAYQNRRAYSGGLK